MRLDSEMGAKKTLLVMAAIFIFFGVVFGEQDTRLPNELEWCYCDIAVKTKSPDLCYKISPEAVYTAAFNSSGHQIYYWRSQCFSDVSRLTGDAKLCDEVKTISTPFLNGSSMSKEQCIANVNRSDVFPATGYACNPELLLKTMGYNKENIPERFIKDGYADYLDFYFENFYSGDFREKLALLPDFSKSTEGSAQADIKEEQDNCANMNDSFERNRCYSDSALEKDDPDICNKIDAQLTQATCMAAVKKDPAICQGIPDSVDYIGGQALCYKEVAIRSQEASLCGKITSRVGNYQRDCYIHFAVKNSDASICNNLTDEFDTTHCYNQYYTNLAVEKKDPSICNSVQEQTSYDMDNCYENYATTTKDKAVCDKIQLGVTKWSCHQELGGKNNHQ